MAMRSRAHWATAASTSVAAYAARKQSILGSPVDRMFAGLSEIGGATFAGVAETVGAAFASGA